MPDRLGKLSKEELELRKLRWDLSFWAKAAAVAIPIAAFIVSASQVWIAYRDIQSKEEQGARDLELKAIESGVRMVEFTNAETDLLLSSDPDKQARALTYASTLLPPKQACVIINAVIIASHGRSGFIEPARRIREVIADRTRDQAQTTPRECQDDTVFDTQNKIAIAIVQATQTVVSSNYALSASPVAEPTAVPPPPAAVPTGPKCPEPANAAKLKLAVYYQIVATEDREKASRIGFDMPEQFPSAGIEYVRSVDPAKQQPQVRFYYPDQKPAAEWLACLLTEAYRRVVGHKPRIGDKDVDFTPVPLGDRYKNLPPNRVEVWFPAISS